MATLFILIGLLPSLLCELPAIPIKLSKETTFITEPLAGDGLPNYALAIQELEAKGVTPEQNGAIPFWQGMGQYQMSDEEFERLSREIGLPAKKETSEQTEESTTAKQAIKDWLRETGRSSDEKKLDELTDNYLLWVESTPWTVNDFPPFFKWLSTKDRQLGLLVEASERPQFYSPYPNLLVDRTLPISDVEMQHTSGMKLAAGGLMARAMRRVAENDLDGAWTDCRSTIALGNHLINGPLLVDQLMAIAVRKKGLKGARVVLSQPNLTPALAHQILDDLVKLNHKIDASTAIDGAERMWALDFTLRLTTNRLGGSPNETKDFGIDPRIMKAGVDLNISLRYINERFDRIVSGLRIENRDERIKNLKELSDEFSRKTEVMQSFGRLSALSQTLRSNLVGEIYFLYVHPAFQNICQSVDQHEQYSRLTTTAAALAVYKAENGRYPKELAELCPAILKEIPNDLYTDEPLRYKLMDDGYLLYSLFENETDDNATDVDGEIRDGEWQDEKQELEREKCDLVIRIPVVPRPKP